jgi:hypothetical protein
MNVELHDVTRRFGDVQARLTAAYVLERQTGEPRAAIRLLEEGLTVVPEWSRLRRFPCMMGKRAQARALLQPTHPCRNWPG